ncbi:MAG: hypothetical protein ACRDHD_05435, partial [Candidatus Limnocylindria bacterium]
MTGRPNLVALPAPDARSQHAATRRRLLAMDGPEVGDAELLASLLGVGAMPARALLDAAGGLGGLPRA